MASAFVSDGSPLDDYFRDNEDETTGTAHRLNDQFQVSDTQDPPPDVVTTRQAESDSFSRSDPGSAEFGEGDTTLVSVNPDSVPTEYTHHHLFSPSPPKFRSSQYSPPGHYPASPTTESPPTPTRTLSDDGFAERFKYAICSSGVLEKDYVPGLGGDENMIQVSTKGGAGAEAKEERGMEVSPEPDGRTRLQEVQRLGKERWDITVAALVLLYGIAVALGSRRALLAAFIIVVGGLGYTIYMTQLLTPSASSSSRHESPEKSKDNNSRTASLTSLASLLAVSRHLDSTIEQTLSLIQPLATPEQLRNLRLTLHRLTGNMTDHLAATTSNLLNLVDKDELAVLGEMYDIPIAGSSFYSRRRSRLVDDDDLADAADAIYASPYNPSVLRTMLGGSIPSPKRPRHSDSALHPQSYAIPMSISQSLPGLYRQDNRPVQLCLNTSSPRMISPLHPRSAPNDRFTSLPNRTPRISKRSSWDSEVWSIARNEGLAPSPHIPSARRLSRPSHEQRITEADEDDDDGQSSSGESRTANAGASGGGHASPIFRKSPFTPKRASPLTSYRIAALAISHSSPGGSPFIPPSPLNIPNPKRRSLQNMPYYPSSDDDRLSKMDNEAGAGLTRTRSMPFSDIQELRSRYATGNTSRRNSLLPPVDRALFSGSPTKSERMRSLLASPTRSSPEAARSAKIETVASFSPLSLHSLKASCLGIHLRRRRLACCLLGLRFQDTNPEYWNEVNELMMSIMSDVDKERNILDDAIKDAKMALEKNWKKEQIADLPPWKRHLPSDGPVDFAPKDPDQALLVQKIKEMQEAMERGWARLQAVKKTLHPEKEQTKMSEDWAEVRRDLGTMVREWERGKEVVSRLSPSNGDVVTLEGEERAEETTEVREPQGKQDLPGFIKAWSDDTEGSPSTSFESTRPLSFEAQDEGEWDEKAELPPPGVDVVFEADPIVLHGLRDNAVLSRDERIRMVKEARAKGVSLAEMLRVGRSGDEEEAMNGREDREAKERGGMVVDELKGMIGIIRRRKGVQEQEEQEQELELEPEQKSTSPEDTKSSWNQNGHGVDRQPVDESNDDDLPQLRRESSRLRVDEMRRQMEEVMAGRNGFVFPATFERQPGSDALEA